MPYWYLFLESHLTTYHSNLGVLTNYEELGTSSLPAWGRPWSIKEIGYKRSFWCGLERIVQGVWMTSKVEYFTPARLKRLTGVSNSATRPPLANTRTRLQSMMVSMRWAMVKTVQLLNTLRIAVWISWSVSPSTAAVASSITSICDLQPPKEKEKGKQPKCEMQLWETLLQDEITCTGSYELWLTSSEAIEQDKAVGAAQHWNSPHSLQSNCWCHYPGTWFFCWDVPWLWPHWSQHLCAAERDPNSASLCPETAQDPATQ